MDIVIKPLLARPRENSGYHALDAGSVIGYLRSLRIVDRRLGGSPTQWQAHERGDGNLNLVFVVTGPSGSVVVKQALPYVRMVGESWPLTVSRNVFENAALREQAGWASHFVPAVYHADDAMALIVMEFLTPHTVLRAGLIGARAYPWVGTHLGLFLAKTLFNTSELRLEASAKKERMDIFCGNKAMCRISEDLIFDEPYFAAPMNRHTSPQLDHLASALIEDTDLNVAAQSMKWRFMNQPESLLHGDLHTGSVMVTDDETRVIDPEFAFYGPMGFDIGVLLANFMMAYLSQPGHAGSVDDRAGFRAYLLDQVTTIWTTFAAEFSTLWHERRAPADADPSTSSSRLLASRLQQIWHDTAGFAGCEIIRRIVGLAHVADFEAIVDPDRRAACERQAIQFARHLLTDRARYGGIADLVAGMQACS